MSLLIYAVLCRLESIRKKTFQILKQMEKSYSALLVTLHNPKLYYILLYFICVFAL